MIDARRVVAAAIMILSGADPAAAFEFFGLFGSDKPPAVSPATLPYTITVEGKGRDTDDDSDVEQALRDASATYKLRHEAPVDGDGLARRLQADTGPTLDALWALGYYDAHVDVLVGDARVDVGEAGIDAAARTAEPYRNRIAVPVKVVATLGPLFRLR